MNRNEHTERHAAVSSTVAIQNVQTAQTHAATPASLAPPISDHFRTLDLGAVSQSVSELSPAALRLSDVKAVATGRPAVRLSDRRQISAAKRRRWGVARARTSPGADRNRSVSGCACARRRGLDRVRQMSAVSPGNRSRRRRCRDGAQREQARQTAGVDSTENREKALL